MPNLELGAASMARLVSMELRRSSHEVTPSVEVRVMPYLLRSSRELMTVTPYCGDTMLLVHSLTALNLMLGGVRWHDVGRHCPTWTGDMFHGECRCDLGDEA